MRQTQAPMRANQLAGLDLGALINWSRLRSGCTSRAAATEPNLPKEPMSAVNVLVLGSAPSSTILSAQTHQLQWGCSLATQCPVRILLVLNSQSAVKTAGTTTG